jgi:uncharacterized protein YaiL (DUF2058 family)
MPSLADQLLKAGIADKKQVKKAQTAKRRENAQKNAQVKQLGKKARRQLQEQQAAQKSAEEQRMLNEKVARDRELNRQKNAAAQAKALQAQIKQLVNMNEVKREGDVAYRFVDGGKTETIYVNALLKRQLSKGQLAIVKLADNYQLVSALVAEKINSRDASVVVSLHDRVADAEDGDDPYADYKIPDDFDW